jgi:transcriptional regulator with XRE-family HTH domain
MGIYERILEKSIEKNISIKKLEQEVGISNGIIKKWNNSSPQCNKLLLVADYLQVSIEWLITGKEYANLTEEENNLLIAYRKASSHTKEIINVTLKPYMEQEIKSSESKIC